MSQSRISIIHHPPVLMLTPCLRGYKNELQPASSRSSAHYFHSAFVQFAAANPSVLSSKISYFIEEVVFIFNFFDEANQILWAISLCFAVYRLFPPISQLLNDQAVITVKGRRTFFCPGASVKNDLVGLIQWPKCKIRGRALERKGVQ